MTRKGMMAIQLILIREGSRIQRSMRKAQRIQKAFTHSPNALCVQISA